MKSSKKQGLRKATRSKERIILYMAQVYAEGPNRKVEIGEISRDLGISDGVVRVVLEAGGRGDRWVSGFSTAGGGREYVPLPPCLEQAREVRRDRRARWVIIVGILAAIFAAIAATCGILGLLGC